jgi:hypothetical protein
MLEKRQQPLKIRSPKYRSEYGATYDKNESLQAARKIAGKMIQKEKND